MGRTLVTLTLLGLLSVLWMGRDQGDFWGSPKQTQSQDHYDESRVTDAYTGRASVIDGDTIEIRRQRIRLTGIDAPESDQLCSRDGQSYRCGQVAANALDGRIANRTVTCIESGTDRYGRVLAECFVGSESLNRWMVQQGHAMAYRRYTMEYAGDEDHARANRVGIWAGGFQAPWEYRSSKRQ